MSYQIVAISNEKGPEEQALNKLERAGASAGEILYANVEHFCENKFSNGSTPSSFSQLHFVKYI